jgi:hypothetical protein
MYNVDYDASYVAIMALRKSQLTSLNLAYKTPLPNLAPETARFENALTQDLSGTLYPRK